MASDDARLPDDVDSPDGYARNRETLRQIAERMRSETSLDIDELIPLIDRASAAYKACRERVEAVEKLLQERLPQTEETDE